MLLLAAAVLFQASLFRAVSRRAVERPLAGRVVAIVSLLLWFSVGISARVIGFA